MTEQDLVWMVACTNGKFKGHGSGGVVSWKGIPYSVQPSSKDHPRFSAAKLPGSDTADIIHDASDFGKACLQPGNEFASQGDDCLTLSVYRYFDGLRSADRPVLVYIHGGGWSTGSHADPLYDGSNFVRNNKDIVLVCINYRFGVQGLVNLDSLKGGEDYHFAKNNGLLDQRCALQWIQRNIRAFGGNPANVTICGESAGAAAVSLQYLIQQMEKMAAKDAGKNFTPLFHKVISMSGGINQSTSLVESVALTNELRKIISPEVESITDLFEDKLRFEDLHAWWSVRNHWLMNYPIRDGSILPLDLYSAFDQYADGETPFLQGATTNEFAYYKAVVPGQYEEILKAIYGMVDTKSVAFRNYVNSLGLENPEEKDIQQELANDYTLRNINYWQARALAHHNAAHNYAYAFDIPYDGRFRQFGAAHGVDLGYLFGFFNNEEYAGTPGQIAFSVKFQEMIANFCRTGDPSYGWAKYAPNSGGAGLDYPIMHFSKEVEGGEEFFRYRMTDMFNKRIEAFDVLRKACSRNLEYIKPWPYFFGPEKEHWPEGKPYL